MFKRIEIKNFLSCQDIVLDNLQGVTALVGRNGSGKTNILKAIQWAVDSITSTQPIKYTFRNPLTYFCFDLLLENELFRFELWVAFEGSLVDDSLQIILVEQLFVRMQNGEFENIFSRQKDKIQLSKYDLEIQTGVATPGLPALIALIPQNPVVRQINKIVNFLKVVRYYPLDELNQPPTEIGDTGLVRQADYEEWFNQYRNRLDSNTSVVMRLLRLFLNKPEDFEELKTLLGNNGLELLKDIFIWKEKENNLYFIDFFPNIDSSDSFKYKKLSLGTRRILRILVSIFHDQSTAFLLEHPEDGVHVGLLHKLIALLKTYSDRGQFILTSHSSEVFNCLKPEEIRLVTMEKGKTYLRALNETEITAAQQFMREEGTLADFLETIQ
jgi:AAA15 family ATPase/GTPase